MTTNLSATHFTVFKAISHTLTNLTELSFMGCSFDYMTKIPGELITSLPMIKKLNFSRTNFL